VANRITYYTSESGKSLKNIFLEQYSDFRNWMFDCPNIYEDFHLKEVLFLESIQFLEENEKIENLQNIDKFVIDDLIKVFIDTYCDFGPGENLFIMRPPFVYVSEYIFATKLIEERCDKETISLWNILLNGRTIKDDSDFTFEEIKIGFWTHDEQSYLRENLESVFGKKQDLYNSEETFFGIINVLQILEGTDGEDKEIVIYQA